MHLTRPLLQARRGAVASPHYLASVAGLEILQAGGSAVDAIIAMNATLGVVYPHMTGMGGDAFWLIFDKKAGKVHALNGSGRAVGKATREHYRRLGHSAIPQRGVHAAATVPGTVDSWCMAHERFGKLSMAALLKSAIGYAREGFPVCAGLERFVKDRQDVLTHFKATSDAYLPGGALPRTGSVMRMPHLAETMEAVAANGQDGFYGGPVANEMVRAVQAEGGVWEKDDLEQHHGDWVDPVSTTYRGHHAYQHPPNCQGFVHLMMLNVLENFDLTRFSDTSADYAHLLVEASKLTFEDRDRYLTDPEFADIPLDRLLSKEYAAELASRIDLGRAAGDLRAPMGQDTTCTVAVDGEGNAVSMIQSIYHEFGSGFIAGETGILLQNRGSFFSLEDDHVNRLEPGKRSFHTLMPGMLLKDGQPHLVYGTMGGEGQPQTSTMLATRVVDYGFDVQSAIDRPRWLYGRTWGEETSALRVESRFGEAISDELRGRGHEIEILDAWSDLTGHAAAIQCHPEHGVLAAGADPRGEGIALGW